MRCQNDSSVKNVRIAEFREHPLLVFCSISKGKIIISG